MTGSPSDRNLPRKDKDLPGYWAVLFVRAVVQHPAGYEPSSPLLLFEKIHGEAAIAFAQDRTLGIRDGYSFRGHDPTAHTLACLRFAGTVTGAVARLATGSGGLTLAGRVSHPLDDESKFHGVIASPPIPIDQQSLVALFFLPAVDSARAAASTQPMTPAEAIPRRAPHGGPSERQQESTDASLRKSTLSAKKETEPMTSDTPNSTPK